MINELDSGNYHRVRPLLRELTAYNVSISGLLNGVNPGRVFVDDPDDPQAAFIETVEGHHLSGDPTNDQFVVEVSGYLQTYFEHRYEMVLCLDPEGWKQRLDEVFTPHTYATLNRRHYVCTKLTYTNWQQALPGDFAVHRIDETLFNNQTLEIPDHIQSWINNNWGTFDQYQRYGFGFCCVHQNKVVSWSVADCASGSRCEIGIQTRPDYRQQGLAAITAAAAVDYALNNGFAEVGWHSEESNIGSWKTAEKVGFIKERDYIQYLVMRDAS